MRDWAMKDPSPCGSCRRRGEFGIRQTCPFCEDTQLYCTTCRACLVCGRVERGEIRKAQHRKMLATLEANVKNFQKIMSVTVKDLTSTMCDFGRAAAEARINADQLAETFRRQHQKP